MTNATISSKGQLAIPKSIRDRLNLKPGTQVSLDVQGEQIVMKRVVPRFPDWKTMRGMVATGPRLTKALELAHGEEMDRDHDRPSRS